MISKWFKRTGNRDNVFLASKFGIIMEGTVFKGIDSSGNYARKALARSLEKLGVDYIDLCES
jgi:aryl-alcohol dehydrogenase-like predicted oxidoreductase